METQNNQIIEEDEINLLDYWRVIIKHKKFIRNLFFASVILTAIVSLIMTKTYRAETTLMPVASSSSQGLAAQLSSLPFAGGLIGTSSMSPQNKIINVLKSRSICENVIDSLDLKKVFFEDDWDEEKNQWDDEEPSMEKSYKLLKEIVKISKDIKSGLISVVVYFPSPELSTKIANQYTIELQKLLNEKTFSIAKKNRIEIQKELQKTKTSLINAEEKLTQYQGNSKVLALDVQTAALIKALAELKAKFVSKQIELGVTKQFATEINPYVLTLIDEIDELKKQISQIESGIQDKNIKINDNAFSSMAEASDIGLNYIRLKRDMMIYEKIFELLSQQSEIAKIDENKESVDFVIIDEARVPERKYKPKRTQMVLIAGITSLFFGIFLAFLLDYIQRVREET